MMRRGLVAILVCVGASIAGCANPDGSGGSVAVEKIASAADLKTRMDAKSVTVVDTLDDAHFKSGHIPGAMHCDYEKMKPESLPADKNTPLVFYCAGGMCPVSKFAANKAAKYGYTRIAVYEGGVKGWKAAGLPVATGEP